MEQTKAIEQTKLDVKVGQWEASFLLFKTTAPRRYDYGTTMGLRRPDSSDEFYTYDSLQQPARFVLIPPVQVEYQVGRYRSGLYQTEPVETWEVDERTLGDLLVGRLFGDEDAV